VRFDSEEILVGLAKSAGLRAVFGVYAAVVFFWWSPGFLSQLVVLAGPLSLWAAWKNHDARPRLVFQSVVWPWLTVGYVLGLVWFLGGFYGLALALASFVGYRTWKYWDTVKHYKELGRMFRQAYTRGGSDDTD